MRDVQNTIQRIFSGLLALAMVIAMVPVQVLAEEEPVQGAVATEAATEPAEETTAPVETETEPTETKPEPTQEIEASTEPAEEETVPEETETATDPTEEVRPVQVESVTIIQEDGLTELAVGETMQLTAVILPEEAAGEKVTWSSSDEIVATVDENGVVTAFSPGDVTITTSVGEICGKIILSITDSVGYTEAVKRESMPFLTSAAQVPEYSDLLLDLNISQVSAVGYQTPYSQSCACFAVAYCRTILDGYVCNWNQFNANGDWNEYNARTGWSTGGGQFACDWPASEDVVVKFLYDQLCAGKPVIVCVTGNGKSARTTGNQHYIAIVGFYNVESRDSLSIDNFLMIDSVGARDSNGNHTIERVEDHYKLFFGDCYQICYDTSGKTVAYTATTKYTSLCIPSPSYGTIKITKADANIMDRPCSVKTDPEAKTIESGALDAEYTVTALYENTEGNYWYRIKTKSGGAGYIYSGNCNFISGLFGDVELIDPNIPTELPHGEPKNIAGTISSPYSKLHEVSFWVYDVAEKKWTGNTVPVSGTSYKLSDPAIDYNVVFNELPVGSYECVVTAKVEAYFVNANGRVGSLYDYELYRGALTIKDPAQIYHTLTFNGNGGTVPQASMSVLHGTTPEYLPMPNFGKEHFAGWYTAAEGGTQVTTSTVITESQTLYAHWGCIHNYSKAEHAPGCVTEGATVYTCFYCGDSYSEPIAALGHDYKGVVTEPTCSSVGYTTYTCSRCSDSYIEENDGNWTEWSEKYPNGVSENLIETKVQYRFRDQETTVHDSDSLEDWTLIGPVSSWSDYGPWSEWSDTAVSESETTKVETRTVWGYYYYLCPNCGKHLYGYGTCFTWANGCGAPTYYHNFCGFWKPVSWDTAGFRDWYGASQYANLDGEIVFKWTDGGTKTQYRSCTRERIEGYQFCRWGKWSEWGDSVQTESDSRQVETRTVYRYAQNSAEHSYGDWEITKEVTSTEEGQEQMVCGNCGKARIRKLIPVQISASVEPATVTAGTDPKDIKIGLSASQVIGGTDVGDLEMDYIITDESGREYTLEEALATPGKYTITPVQKEK